MSGEHMGPNPDRTRIDDLESDNLSDAQLGRGDVEEKIESDEEIGKGYSSLRGGHANPFHAPGDVGIEQETFEIKDKEKFETIIKKLQAEIVALKGEALHKTPKTGNLIDLFSEMADELIATDERAKAQILDEYAIELQRKIETIANSRQEIEEVIEALETTYLEQTNNTYLTAKEDEDHFERTHPDDHWTAESQAAKEVQNKRIKAYDDYKEAQIMVEEIVPVLRAIAERLN
jgi:hypothetical protein